MQCNLSLNSLSNRRFEVEVVSLNHQVFIRLCITRCICKQETNRGLYVRPTSLKFAAEKENSKNPTHKIWISVALLANASIHHQAYYNCKATHLYGSNQQDSISTLNCNKLGKICVVPTKRCSGAVILSAQHFCGAD